MQIKARCFEGFFSAFFNGLRKCDGLIKTDFNDNVLSYGKKRVVAISKRID